MWRAKKCKMLLDRHNFLERSRIFFYAYSLKCLDSIPSGHRTHPYTEAKFLDVIGSFPLCYTQTSLLMGFSPPSPLSKSNLKLVWNVNIVYGNLKWDYAQKPQQKILRSWNEFGFSTVATPSSCPLLMWCICLVSLWQERLTLLLLLANCPRNPGKNKSTVCIIKSVVKKNSYAFSRPYKDMVTLLVYKTFVGLSLKTIK